MDRSRGPSAPTGKRLAAGGAAGGRPGGNGKSMGRVWWRIWDATRGEHLFDIRGPQWWHPDGLRSRRSAAWPPFVRATRRLKLWERADRPGTARLPRAQASRPGAWPSVPTADSSLRAAGTSVNGVDGELKVWDCADRPGSGTPSADTSTGSSVVTFSPGWTAPGHRRLRWDREALGRPDRSGKPSPCAATSTRFGVWCSAPTANRLITAGD